MQQEGLQPTEGTHERDEDLAVVNGRTGGSGGREGEDPQRVSAHRCRLITKKYKEYTEEYLKLLEAQQEEEKKAKEQNEVKVKSSLNSQVLPRTPRTTQKSRTAAP
jgi:hypothetical protein